MYGADADLIMLGLITHEAHFYNVRESFSDITVTCTSCGRQGHLANECATINPMAPVNFKLPSFLFLKASVLREYLYVEFEKLCRLPIFDFERVIDDFVFLCFFVGNDFLPNLPSLHIREGGID